MNKNIEELPQKQETLEDLVKTLNANDSWDLYCIGIKLREKSVWLEELTKKTNECWELQEENQQLKKQKDDVVEYIKKYLQEHVIDDLPDEESKFETENGIPIPNAKEILLRMLGEIE